MAGFLSINGAFSAAGGMADGGFSVGVKGGGDLADEADEDANVDFVVSITFDAEGSLNARFSTAACKLDCTFISKSRIM